jgi:hypothetical protein
MMDLMIMRGHMPVGRVVAAKGYTAGLTGAQVQPPAMYFDAFFTNMFFCRFDFCDRAQMFAQMAVFAHT